VLSRDPHRPFDLLDKVNELNRRVRELELRDVPTRSELPTSTGTPSIMDRVRLERHLADPARRIPVVGSHRGLGY
jgi:hypothetical protein